jgi:hypothetical protein
MKEFTWSWMTTKAFTNPITQQARMTNTPTMIGLKEVCCSSQAAKTPAKATIDPMERSYMPAASGTTTDSAIIPVIAYSLKIDLAVRSVGNASGEMIVNKITMKTKT